MRNPNVEYPYEFDHAADPIGIDPTTASGTKPEAFDLPEAADPTAIDAESVQDPAEVVPEPSPPRPHMKRYTLPSNGNPVKVVPLVKDYRRIVWIVARGDGGLQASYSNLFNDPDYVDVQVNGIPIPLFSRQDLWMRVIDAVQGNDLEVSIIVEPRSPGR